MAVKTSKLDGTRPAFFMWVKEFLLLFFSGNGVVIHVPQLFAEMEKNEGKAMAPVDSNRLKISDRYENSFEFDGENPLS